MTAKVQGVARLNAKLKALPKAAEAAIRTAMEKSAEDVVRAAKSFVPVATGALRDSIGWSWGAAPEGSFAVGQVKAQGLSLTIFAGNDKAYYARWVEFGTVAQRGHPFFFPAYRAYRKTAKSRIKRAITKAAKVEAA